ncbi:hypothetical protein [Rhodococcus wratislaviensis]|uniref:hypothetical protein n=1 Tax=Rhodococcus wratislaviensis TaxID=44752 RepID=UPI00366233CD
MSARGDEPAGTRGAGQSSDDRDRTVFDLIEKVAQVVEAHHDRARTPEDIGDFARVWAPFGGVTR